MLVLLNTLGVDMICRLSMVSLEHHVLSIQITIYRKSGVKSQPCHEVFNLTSLKHSINNY